MDEPNPSKPKVVAQEENQEGEGDEKKEEEEA